MLRLPAALVNPPGHRNRGEVVEGILKLMQEGGLNVGDQLPSIRELASTLKVKPSVVRDALLEAQTMGLVGILPRAGAFVQSLTPAPPGDSLAGALRSALARDEHNLIHLRDARRLIEIELAGRAAERCRLEDLLPVRRALEALVDLSEAGPWVEYVEQDIRFHVEIARVAGNSFLFAVEQTLMEMLRPYFLDRESAQRRRLTDEWHTAIYARLAAGDVAEARAAMREHLSLAYDELLRGLQAPPAAKKRQETAPT